MLQTFRFPIKLSGSNGYAWNERKHKNSKNNNGDNNGKRSSNHEHVQQENTIAAVSGGLMAVLFGMSAQSPFDSSCQNDAADKVKLLIDKKKFVLSQSLSTIKQQSKLEKNGNMYNGKLYDEKNVRTVKVDQKKKLECELQNSENENVEYFTTSSPVMTCGANVVANVKEALFTDTTENKVLLETPTNISQDSIEVKKDSLVDACTNR